MPLYIQSMQRAVHDAGSQKTAFKLIEFCWFFSVEGATKVPNPTILSFGSIALIELVWGLVGWPTSQDCGVSGEASTTSLLKRRPNAFCVSLFQRGAEWKALPFPFFVCSLAFVFIKFASKLKCFCLLPYFHNCPC